MKTRHLTSALAIGAIGALALAGCASGNQAEGGSGEGGGKGTITLGFLPSWTDGLSTAYLLEDQLGKLGYTVKMQTLTEAGELVECDEAGARAVGRVHHHQVEWRGRGAEGQDRSGADVGAATWS